MRPIDADLLLRNTINNPNHAPYITKKDVQALPTVQPEPHEGHWIRVAGMNERCSACNKYFPLSYFTGRPFDINYCPNCGAKMKGERQK